MIRHNRRLTVSLVGGCSLALAGLALLPGGMRPAQGQTAGPGNSAAAHACQQGGYLDFTREDGTAFANTGECVSYAAQGGTLVPVSPTP
jgi:hypothetical protein